MSDPSAVFSAALKRFKVTAKRRVLDAFIYATEEVDRSITYGSELTGAPGQPVRTGNLLVSYEGTFTSKTTWDYGTSVEYAIWVEDGANDVAFFDPSREDGLDGRRSEVGGYHSVKLTEASWDRIVEFAARKAQGVVISGG